MVELFISTLVTFFVIIDPIGCAPIFAGLTAGATHAQRNAMAVRAVAVAAIILVVFALVGEQLLHGLGIGLPSFRIAGGIMLFLIALEMVFEKRTQRREDRAQKLIETPEVEDVSIFPMAMPYFQNFAALLSGSRLRPSAQVRARAMMLVNIFVTIFHFGRKFALRAIGGTTRRRW